MRSEEGFGLVDFLLALALGSILMLAIGSVFQTGFQAIRASSESTTGNDAVQQVLQWISRDAHGGTPDDLVACVVAVPAQFCPRPIVLGDTVQTLREGNTLRLGATEMVASASGRFVFVTYRYEILAGTQPPSAQVVRETVDAAGLTRTTIIARDLDGTFAGPVFSCAAPGVAFTLSQAVTGGAAQQVVNVATSQKVRVGTKLYVDHDNADLAKRETVVARVVPNAASVKAVFAKTHASGASVALDTCPQIQVTMPMRSFFGTLMRTASVALRIQP